MKSTLKLSRLALSLTAIGIAGALVSCGSGGPGGSGTTGGTNGSPAGNGGLTTLNFAVAPLGQEFLSSAEVNDIVARAVQASRERGQLSTIAITDRVGNVVAVYQMNGAPAMSLITSGTPDAQGKGLDGTPVPSSLTAIAKAITGAYLSSTGNAFTTRTASQIVQEFFQPGEVGQPSGPLYGVQFSQLPCSDLSVWLSQSSTIGPKRSPLGLSADPGGFPIYQNGRVVGGIGVMGSSNASIMPVYGLDKNLQDVERDIDEEIAFAALPEAFRAPDQIRANRITVGGQTAQFSNSTPAPANAASPADLTTLGSYVALPGYKTTAAPIDGVAYGLPASGYTTAVNPAFAGLDAYTLVTSTTNAAAVRYPPKDAADGKITAQEVQNILVEGIKIANRARGQIRAPLGSAAQVTVSVIDTNGDIIGLLRSADAPIFGTDVSVQKARSSLTFSSADGLADFQKSGGGAAKAFVDAMDVFFANKPRSLDGSVAFSARAVGNVHRPYFPDGQVGTPKGPLSTPINEWSPFNIGFQLNVVAGEVLAALGKAERTVINGNPFAPAAVDTCVDESTVTSKQSRFANGFQIFPGGFPIYKGNELVGAVGVSGDGIDQDDMIGYLGVFNAGRVLNSPIRPFPSTSTRADSLNRSGVFLKYAQCPQAPFLDSSEQNVCPGQ
ncbi:MAG: heme-binding protein [Limnobacter sp.]|nr:heme-binding protein [Limnobacter sp.]